MIDMSKKELAVVKEEETALVEAKALDTRGFEDLDMADLPIPTAKLLQPTSPELTDDAFEEFNLKAGQIVHSLSKEQLEGFVPIKFYKDKMMFVPKNDSDKKYMKDRVKSVKGIELSDDDMQSMFVCRARDNKNGSKFGSCAGCPFNKFDGNKKPLCNENVNVVGIFENSPMPAVIRFTSTSLKHGNQFVMLAMTFGGTLFARKYKLVSLKKQQDGNTWYELTVRPAGKASEDEFEYAETMYEMYKTKEFVVEDEVKPEVFVDAEPKEEKEELEF